jgi:hypothetical protein
VTKQWFRFALGRLEDQQDACSLAKLDSDFRSSDRDVKALLQSIVLSDAFRSKRIAGGTP